MNSVEQNSIIHEPLWRQVDHTVTLVMSPNLSGNTKKEPPVVNYHRLIFADFNDIYQMFIL